MGIYIITVVVVMNPRLRHPRRVFHQVRRYIGILVGFSLDSGLVCLGWAAASIFPSNRRSCATRCKDLPISAVVGTSDSYLILASEPEPLSSSLTVARVEDEVSCVDGTGERGLRYCSDTSGYEYRITGTSF